MTAKHNKVSAKGSRRATKALTASSGLARPGDPYVTRDGRIIQPEYAGPSEDQPELTMRDFKPSTRRGIKELPSHGSTMNGICCILVYTMLGLGDREIAEVTGVSVEDVRSVKELQAYDETFQMMSDQFVNINSDLIQSRIAAYGHGALTSLAHVAFRGKIEGNRMRASQDLLTRGGHTKEMLSQRNGFGADDLRIVISEGERTVEVNMGNLGGTK